MYHSVVLVMTSWLLPKARLPLAALITGSLTGKWYPAHCFLLEVNPAFLQQCSLHLVPPAPLLSEPSPSTQGRWWTSQGNGRAEVGEKQQAASGRACFNVQALPCTGGGGGGTHCCYRMSTFTLICLTDSPKPAGPPTHLEKSSERVGSLAFCCGVPLPDAEGHM